MKRSPLLLGCLLVAGCPSKTNEGAHEGEGRHPHGHLGEHEHEHEHAEGAVTITVWSEQLELFAEHPPAIVGEPLTLLSHVTVLESFRPLEAGVVRLVLEGPETLSAETSEAVRAGIFELRVTPSRAGTYRGRVHVESEGLQDVVGGFEIIVHASPSAVLHDESEGAAQREQISLLKEQQWELPLQTAFATRGTVSPTLEVAGEITTPPGGQAIIGAPVAGRVVVPKDGLPRPGSTVKKGALLASIAPAPTAPEDSARVALGVAEAKARLETAAAAVARAKRLLEDRAIPQRQLEEAEREHAVALEAVRAAQRASSLHAGAASGQGGGSYRLTAPIDGVIASVHATPGATVLAGAELFHIVDPAELWIRARVPETNAASLRPDADAAFKMPGSDSWLPLDITGEDANAEVVSLGRTVDPNTRTVTVLYALRTARTKERDLSVLRVGAMVRVAVPLGAAVEGVVVPSAAVLPEEGRSVVYVQVDGETFEERPVDLGPRSGDRVVVKRGIQPGERIVVAGGNLIRLADHGSAAPAHGHVH